MINFLQETLEDLHKAEKNSADVCWVQVNDFHFPWADFVAVANFTYNNGYGGAEINQTLKIVGKDWWLERGEYDGSEWWEFKTLPTRPEVAQIPTEKDLRDA